MNENKEKLLIPSAGCIKNLLLIAPFFQLLFCLHVLEPFLFWGSDDSFLHFSLLIVLCIACYFLLKLFFRIAKTWQKWLMYIYIVVLVLQTGVGLMYKYYEPPLEKFTKEELVNIEHYIQGSNPLAKDLEVLAWNDSIGIIGKKTIDGIWRYQSENNINSKEKESETFYYKYSAPDDFRFYLKLAGQDKIHRLTNNYFWLLQYPNRYIYIYVKGCDCGVHSKHTPCHIYFNEAFSRDLHLYLIKPIIWEIFDGKLDDRYRNFYKFFQKLAHPTYVRTDLANDPYYLIYQGKYKEAREGLKDLPPARKEFCEKKLEALGY